MLTPSGLEVRELGSQPGEVAVAVVVGVGEGADVEFVDDGVFVPEGVRQEIGRHGERVEREGRRGEARPGSGADFEVALGAGAALDAEDVRGERVGVELDVVAGAVPRVAFAAEDVVDLERPVLVRCPTP